MRELRLLAAVACLTAAAACSGPPPRVATVAGKVTYAGGPLPGGRVQFKALGPNPQVMVSTGMIQPDGRYLVTEVPVGPTAVSVETESVKLVIQQWEGGNCPYKYVELPKKHTEFDTAGLALEVKPGKQEFDINLVK